jgi:hypothetical protein
MKKNHRFLIMILISAIVSMIFFSNCKKDAQLPTVVTTEISLVTDSSAVSGGIVTSDGGAKVITRGVIWSPYELLFFGWNSQTSDGEGTGVFVSSLSDLDPATEYYYQAYATNSVGTAFGEKLVFTTLP